VKKLLSVLISLLFPSVLILLYFLIGYLFLIWKLDNSLIAIFYSFYFIFYYIVTIVGIKIFFKFKPCSTWILNVGFILPLSICFIIETLYPSVHYYEFTILFGLFYTVPFIIFSIIVAFIITLRKNKHIYK